ncbi:hypothetical protein [Stenotrophomonas sp. YIM B06876]|uniref:hypothetical protein n=1 Tax=Stenotrophomonas sp. YIM B06876 TaxID=3060211 RepID=UPI0027392F16|nr:hypothetical protein [Stenotrophomonas sp. YIM B06876]
MLLIMQISNGDEAPSRHASSDPFQTAALPGITAWLSAVEGLSEGVASASAGGGAVAVCWQAPSDRESSSVPRQTVVFIGKEPCV